MLQISSELSGDPKASAPISSDLWIERSFTPRAAAVRLKDAMHVILGHIELYTQQRQRDGPAHLRARNGAKTQLETRNMRSWLPTVRYPVYKEAV
jgi:hypothetical protein